MSRQKELGVDAKTIQQMELVRQLKTTKDDGNANGHQSMFVLTILEKKKKNKTQTLTKKRKSFLKEDQISRNKS